MIFLTILLMLLGLRMNKNQNLKLIKIPTNGLTSLRVRLGLGKQNALESISEGQFFKKGEEK